MRRLVLITLIASFASGCGVAPTTGLAAPRKAAAASAPKSEAAAPKATVALIRTIPGYKGPSVSVTTNPATALNLGASQEAAAELIAQDSDIDSIELLIQDGGAYFVQGWFQDLKDYVKRTWTRWKLSWEVKSALKHTREKSFELHEGEIDNIKKNRTDPKTKVNALPDNAKEIVTTWSSTNGGAFEIETRRTIDEDGVTQILSVWVTGEKKNGQVIDIKRIRTLTGEDGTYKVATTNTTTGKDGRPEYQEWLKQVKADGAEVISGFINHADGYCTEITGTRDTKGKVKVEVSKLSPEHNPHKTPAAAPEAAGANDAFAWARD